MRDDVTELSFLLSSKFPIIVVETPEEPRFLHLVERATRLAEMALFTWSVVNGLERPSRSDVFTDTNDLHDALMHIRRQPQNGAFVFLDAQPFLDNPVTVRQIRELSLSYQKIARTLIFVGSQISLPPDLQRMSATFQLSLPGIDDIRELFREEISFWKTANPGQALRGDQAALDMLVQHLVGFTRDDARRLIRQSIEDDGMISMEDVARVLKHKHQSLAGGGVLSLELSGAHFSDVGGQAALKHWLSLRYPVFIGQSGTGTLTPPRGVLLLGVQGSGKSLAAKSIAGSWQVPLLRLDFGALYNKFTGETERNLRESLRTAQSMAPCVLWLDEIDKGLAHGSDSSDGGVSRRLLGAFLTWMSERNERVFMVATANDISSLPPELLRKGRFDEIFFVDLPNATVRKDIFTIHLKKRALAPEGFDLEALSDVSAGFSGAEIEQAVIAAQYEAFSVKRPLDTEMLVHELRRTRPLSVVRAEEIEALRDWAAERTVSVDEIQSGE